MFIATILLLIRFGEAYPYWPIQRNTVNYNWDITWVNVNPDQRASRPAVGINGQWPGPTISGNTGDEIVVTVNNKLGNESTSIHWHGIHQYFNNNNDGPPSEL